LYYQFTTIQTHHGGIIGAIKSYDDIFLKRIFKITQYLGQVLRTNLASSAGAVGIFGKFNLIVL
jgi:hypothetical protein